MAFRRIGSHGVLPLVIATVCAAALFFTAASAQGMPIATQDGGELQRWWPVIVVAVATIAWAVRTEALAKSAAKDLEGVRAELNDKLTFYATSADLGEVRAQTLVAVSQVGDLKPALVRLEGKLDAVLLSRMRSSEHGRAASQD